jgi:hypothetical protein
MAAALPRRSKPPGSRRPSRVTRPGLLSGSARNPDERLAGPHRALEKNALGFLVIFLPMALIGFGA